jgi:MFS family permease
MTPGETGAWSPGGWLSGGLDHSTLVVAGVATLGLIMAVLDTTIVNVALDTLSRELHSPLSTIQWVSTGYLLSLAAVIPLSGWLTERFGSKRTWIASIALFALGSGLCALATSAEELIGFRILQGLGGGMLMPVGFTLIAQSAGPRRVGRALAVVGVPILLGPIFGPIIGGLIVDNTSWQWIFVVNVPIAAAAILLAARVLKPDAGRVDAGKLDWLGAALVSWPDRNRVRPLRDRDPRGDHSSDRAGPNRRGGRDGRSVHLAQPARRTPADRPTAVSLDWLQRGRWHHVLPRRGVVRHAADPSALLSGGPR